MRPAPDTTVERVKLELTRTVVVVGTDDRPALELKASGDDVRVALLPRNGSNRAPVKLSDLVVAVGQLQS